MKMIVRLLGCMCALVCCSVLAEVNEVRIARQDGLGYLPLLMMEEYKLIEKHARAAGLPEVKVTWPMLYAGPAMNDALLSGDLDFASGGVPPFLVLWDRTRASLGVKAVSALVIYPHFLVTRNPNIKSVKDFTEKDRISVPAVKVSNQAILLQMEAEKVFGVGQHDRLDRFTISMPPADTTMALLSPGHEVNTMYSTPPYQYQLVEAPGISLVLKSYDTLGGPTTVLLLWATSKFYDANPKTYGAVLAALDEAITMINKDQRNGAQVYIKASRSKDSVDNILKMMGDMKFGGTPNNVMRYADFMGRVGSIKVKPASWKELFFPNAHSLPGS